MTETSRRAQGGSRLDDVRLVSNATCLLPGHEMCWRVECRRCGAHLAAHVEAEDIRVRLGPLLGRHACPGGSGFAGPRADIPSA